MVPSSVGMASRFLLSSLPGSAVHVRMRTNTALTADVSVAAGHTVFMWLALARGEQLVKASMAHLPTRMSRGSGAVFASSWPDPRRQSPMNHDKAISVL